MTDYSEPAIRAAVASDFDAIRDVIRDAFGQTDEADLVDALRSQGRTIELVAEASGMPVGHVLLSPLEQPVGAYALAPLSVHPRYQRRGIGAALAKAAVAEAKTTGVKAVFVLGEPGFYARAGFSRAAAGGFHSPYPPEYMGAIELTPGWLAANGDTLSYPQVFEGA